MNKVIVIGSPGSGKSYFSTKIASFTKLPLYHLDMIYHKSDGTQIEKCEFDRRLNDILAKDKWIIDGNYDRTLEVRLDKCDTVFFLDIDVNTCLEGAENRIGKRRSDLPWIETKFDPEFKQKIIDFPKSKLPRIYELIDKYKNEKEIIIFRTRNEIDNYIFDLENKESS